MKKSLKYSLLAVGIFILAAGLVAFRPIGGDINENGIPDHTETLAEVLNIDVDTLQTAVEAAREKALAQAVADGIISAEKAEQLQSRNFGGRAKHFGFGGTDYETYLAAELGISTEALQTAQRQAAEIQLEQALEDGTISQEEYDQMQVHIAMRPYFEEAFSSVFQEAIDAALADGAITDEQAEILQNNSQAGGRGFGMGRPHGGKHFFHAIPGTEGD